MSKKPKSKQESIKKPNPDMLGTGMANKAGKSLQDNRRRMQQRLDEITGSSMTTKEERWIHKK